MKEFGSNNVKVKRESYALIGLMYQHLGPALKALLLSMTSQSTVKEQLQKCFDENAYDPAIKSANWAKRSIQLNRTNSSGSEGQSHLSVNLEIPKTDLIASLPKDLLSRMVRLLFNSSGNSFY